MKNTKVTIQATEGLIKGLLENTCNIHELMIAIHNVCAHGKIITDNGGHISKDDHELHQLFEGFDLSISAAKEMYY